MANKLACLLRRHPALLLVVLVVLALVAARFGHIPGHGGRLGLWDGPI
ncbi:MAG TPA: hypothetical protein VGC78_02620 [Gaiellaceae bacterium]